jgi:hypothetical protein
MKRVVLYISFGPEDTIEGWEFPDNYSYNKIDMFIEMLVSDYAFDRVMEHEKHVIPTNYEWVNYNPTKHSITEWNNVSF